MKMMLQEKSPSFTLYRRRKRREQQQLEQHQMCLELARTVKGEYKKYILRGSAEDKKGEVEETVIELSPLLGLCYRLDNEIR